MGRESICDVILNGQKANSKVLLESQSIIIRGELRTTIPLESLTHAEVQNGCLQLTWPLPTENTNAKRDDAPDASAADPAGTGPGTAQSAQLFLGDEAGKWLTQILNPKSRLDKLGVKAGRRVGLVGLHSGQFRQQDTSPGAFEQELQDRGVEIARVEPGAGLEQVFYFAPNRDALAALATLKKCLRKDGGIWVLSPKKNPDITEQDVMGRAKDAGLVDVKVVGFSEKLTAARLVIPKAQR